VGDNEDFPAEMPAEHFAGLYSDYHIRTFFIALLDTSGQNIRMTAPLP